MIGFNFCGLDSYADLNLIVNEIHDPVGPSVTENAQAVPGMVGNIFQGNSYGSKQIDIDVTIIADSNEERAAMLHDLASLFLQTGSSEYPMIFGNEPDYTYYGHFTSISVPQRLSQTDTNASMTLSFVCSDPAAYGEQKSLSIASSPQSITAEGGIKTYPILSCMLKKDVTKIAVADQGGNYIYLGNDIDPDTGGSPIDNEPRILHDECTSLAPWSAVSSPTFSLENGVASGSNDSTAWGLTYHHAADGSGFGPVTSGKWYGPVRQQWLSASCDDYQITTWLYNFQHYPRAKGKIELYLLDTDGNRIGRIGLKDAGDGSNEVYMIVELGDSSQHKELYYGTGDIKKTSESVNEANLQTVAPAKKDQKTTYAWKTIKKIEEITTDTFTNFYGWITVRKVGQQFTCDIMKCDPDTIRPLWSNPIHTAYTDIHNYYQKPLAGLAVYFAKYAITEDTSTPVYHYADNGLSLNDVSVWHIINGGNAAGSAYPIARVGDEIVINCEEHRVYKNGATWMQELAIGSTWLDLPAGIPKTLAFDPMPGDADWSIDYRPMRG